MLSEWVLSRSSRQQDTATSRISDDRDGKVDRVDLFASLARAAPSDEPLALWEHQSRLPQLQPEAGTALFESYFYGNAA